MIQSLQDADFFDSIRTDTDLLVDHYSFDCDNVARDLLFCLNVRSISIIVLSLERLHSRAIPFHMFLPPLT